MSRLLKLSIVVPILNEVRALPLLMDHLLTFGCQGCEILLVDGGSTDGSIAIAEAAGFTLLRSEPGRARQMNRGAAFATGEVILFLHADTRLPDAAASLILAATTPRQPGRISYEWGRFDVSIDGDSPVLALVARLMNWRSALSGIVTGDQAIFIRRALFFRMGGFPEQPLMEDIALSKRLKQATFPPARLRERVITSGRRWDERGVWTTIFLMWRLRWRYWRGVSAEKIAADYR